MLQELPINQFSTKVTAIWDETWFLLTCGDFKKKQFNTMTIGWGSFGYLWKMPMVMVAVRPTRYTHEFITKFDTFTLTAFPEKYRTVLNLLGKKSGRDGNKIEESGLTPAASERIDAPGFAEADLWIECRKMYWHDFDPEKFLLDEIFKVYTKSNFHTMFFGKIEVIKGDPEKFQLQ